MQTDITKGDTANPKAAAPTPDAVEARDPRTLDVPKDEKETLAVALARTILRPSVQSADTIMRYSAGYSKKITLMGLVDELSKQCVAVHHGDLQRAESMLIAQAHALDSIFGTLARNAALNMGEYPQAFERFMRLALKAQGQCRATLETLAAIKNPPVVYARQANVTTGPQQINNGMGNTGTNTRARTQAREIENQPNKLSGIGNELPSNTGASALAGGVNQAMETVGAIDRAEVKGG